MQLITDRHRCLAMRTHRALTWLHRAEQEPRDQDARFVFLWIAFNAAYANEISDRRDFSERRQFVHGGSTWNSKVNRSQVTDGARFRGNMYLAFVSSTALLSSARETHRRRRRSAGPARAPGAH